MRKNRLLLPVLILATSGIHAREVAVPVTNCSPHAKPPGKDERQDLGPYRLASIHCVDTRKIYDSATPSLSPDGSRAAWADYDGITIVDIRSGRSSFFNAPTRNLNFKTLEIASPTVWAQDSVSLLGTTRDQAKGGFPTSGGKIVQFAIDGSRIRTPDIVSPSGPLDAVQWVPGTSMAIAQFGTHGSIYQPIHADPDPELAMIDTTTGRVLDRPSLRRLKSFSQRTPGSDPRYAIKAATAVNAENRLRSIVTIQTRQATTWVHWTEGLPPTEVAVPKTEKESRIALLPSGRQFLQLHTVQPIGLQVTHPFASMDAKRPEPPTPRMGTLLQLRSTTNGKPLWSMHHRFVDFWRAQIFEISPDARYALISWPDRHAFDEQVALIDLRSGTLAQLLPLSPSGGQAGFSDGGKRLWIWVANTFRMYRQR